MEIRGHRTSFRAIGPLEFLEYCQCERKFERLWRVGAFYGIPCVRLTSSSTLSAMTCSTVAVNGRG